MTRSSKATSAWGGILGLLIAALTILAIVIGWVLNLVHVAKHCLNGDPVPFLHIVIEIVGVFFFPLGVYLGYCH